MELIAGREEQERHFPPQWAACCRQELQALQAAACPKWGHSKSGYAVSHRVWVLRLGWSCWGGLH